MRYLSLAEVVELHRLLQVTGGVAIVWEGRRKRILQSSGSNLHCRVEVDLSRPRARHHGTLTRPRRSNPIGPHPAEMKLNRRLNTLER